MAKPNTEVVTGTRTTLRKVVETGFLSVTWLALVSMILDMLCRIAKKEINWSNQLGNNDFVIVILAYR